MPYTCPTIGLLIVYGLGYCQCYVVQFYKKKFNFSINNVVRKPIIDKGLFYIFKFVKEDSREEEISGFIIVLLERKGHSL